VSGTRVVTLGVTEGLVEGQVDVLYGLDSDIAKKTKNKVQKGKEKEGREGDERTMREKIRRKSNFVKTRRAHVEPCDEWALRRLCFEALVRSCSSS
jgi:hypothetical protein